MTEENLNEVKVEEKKECNCPVCKILKSDCTKKFLATILASFIGCSLAILAFLPRPNFVNKRPCPPPPYVKMYDRQMPPREFRGYDRQVPPEFRMGKRHHGEFSRRHHNPEFKRHHRDFKGPRGEFRPERPMETPQIPPTTDKK